MIDRRRPGIASAAAADRSAAAAFRTPPPLGSRGPGGAELLAF